MGILKSIFRVLFSSEEKKPQSRKSSQTTAHSGQRQVEELQKKIEYSGAYIQHLRLDRSWVLPQMVEMGFDRSGKFDREKYLSAVKNLGVDKIWSLIIRNFGVILEHPETERKRWWKKEVAVKVAEADYEMMQKEIEFLERRPFTNCKGGPYIELRKDYKGRKRLLFINDPVSGTRWNKTNSCTVEMFKAEMQKLISEIRSASSPEQLLKAIKRYDAGRLSSSDWHEAEFHCPDEFVDAYAGDGAYYAMMTMVKHLGLCYKDEYGRLLTRDECISEIKREKEFSTGMQMLAFCEKKFFFSKVFDCSKYKKGLYRQ